MRVIKGLALGLGLALTIGSVASSAYAWIPDQLSTTIVEITSFHDTVSTVIVRAASGHRCHFDTATNGGKSLMSAAVAAYLSQKPVNLTCYDAVESIAGFNTRRLHRLQLQ